MDLKEKLKELEEQVSEIKDAELRKIAFETLLMSLTSGKKIKASGKPKKIIKKTNKKKQSKAYSIVKDLNLREKGKKSLADFFKEAGPAMNMEYNAVFVYYLENILNIGKINVDHIYTCYKGMKLRIPLLRQSVIDTSHRKGWIDTEDMQGINLTTIGENFVEHDLPERRLKEKKGIDK